MNAGVNEISRWLRYKQNGPIPQVNNTAAEVATTREEAGNMIKTHWKQVWNRFPGAEEKTERISKAKDMFRGIFHGIRGDATDRWRRPTISKFTKKLKQAHGAGGPDGWQACELRMLPPEVVKQFSELTQRWEQNGAAPASLATAKQSNLVKPGKVQEKNGVHSLYAGDTRPISVFSLWWRVWGSTWVTDTNTAKLRKR